MHAIFCYEKMKLILSLILFITLLTSVDEKRIVIDETGFGDTRIGRTTLSEIKRQHRFAKHTKTFKHVLFRTDTRTEGVTYHYEEIETRKGITYFFVYRSGTPDDINLSEIKFEYPAKVVTDKGIRLCVSNFKDVEREYGIVPTAIVGDRPSKVYDDIEFYAGNLVEKVSVDENYIVTAIRVKKKVVK
jgi:hypothetical protein